MVRTLGRGPVNPFHVEREVARSKNIYIYSWAVEDGLPSWPEAGKKKG